MVVKPDNSKNLKMNKAEAIQATRYGAIAACIVAALTLILVLIANYTNAEQKLANFSDPWILLDVIIILIFAFGVYRKSRVASILLFLYYIASKIIIIIETQSYSGLFLGFIFLYFFAKAIQGSFVYHKLEKDENPDYKSMTKWVYIIGIPLVLIFFVLTGYALLSTIGVVPSQKVQHATEIRTTDINTLIDNGIIAKEEKVEYFYSQGSLSILESGNILTTNHVILYFTNENKQLEVHKIPINEIVDVKLESKGNIFKDNVYKVSTNDPNRWIPLFLSEDQKGDQIFVEAILKKLSNK